MTAGGWDADERDFVAPDGHDCMGRFHETVDTERDIAPGRICLAEDFLSFSPEPPSGTPGSRDFPRGRVAPFVLHLR